MRKALFFLRHIRVPMESATYICKVIYRKVTYICEIIEEQVVYLWENPQKEKCTNELQHGLNDITLFLQGLRWLGARLMHWLVIQVW